MSAFLTRSKHDCSRWAIGWGIVGAAGLVGLVLTVFVTEWPVSVEALISVVWGWMIGLGISQPLIALAEYRRDINFEKQMRSLYR